MAYICGFGGIRNLRDYIEYKWEMKRNQLIPNGVEDTTLWERCGDSVIWR